MNTGSSDEQYISTREAAQLLGVALRTVQLWVEAGTLSAWKTAGGHRRITRGSVDSVLNARRKAMGGTVATIAPAHPMTMLVVEDDADLLRLYELNIEGWDLPLRVLTARNGFEGMRMIGEHHPDILITDLNMPGIDGFRMLRTFSTWPDFKRMLVVAVTALSPADVADRGGLPDGVGLFTKPAPFQKLEQMVRAWVLQAGRTAPKTLQSAGGGA